MTPEQDAIDYLEKVIEASDSRYGRMPMKVIMLPLYPKDRERIIQAIEALKVIEKLEEKFDMFHAVAKWSISEEERMEALYQMIKVFGDYRHRADVRRAKEYPILGGI
jgi:hypothetical protein